MVTILKKYISIVDSINERVAFVSWILFFMMFTMAYEVVARYIFNSPTIWAWDINVQLLCVFAVMSGGYVLRHNGHIRSDIFYVQWSLKKKVIMDLITSFLPLFLIGAAFYSSIKLATRSFELKEITTTALHLPLYPLRMIIVVGVFLFLLQLIRDLIQRVLFLMGKIDPEEME